MLRKINMLHATEVTTQQELLEINKLNQKNLKINLSKEDQEEQGFVTWLYDISLLKQIAKLAPGIIVKDDDTVVGYALVTPVKACSFHPDLQRMIDNIKTINYKGKPLSSYAYYIMGQVCIDKNYRGKGIFPMLFKKLKELYSGKYELLVTEISTKNYRSLKHMKKLDLLPYIHTTML